MAKHQEVTLDSLCNRIMSYFPDAPLNLVREAYSLAEQAHSAQKRANGDPYIIHPLEVADVIAQLQLDVPSIVTGLLHDTVEDTPITLSEIEQKFGKDIATLVDGVTKLNKMAFKTSEEKQAENFRKMVVAMSKDIRVILVKLADRLNNMRTLSNLPPHKQKVIAQETLDIYAPLANRLGIGWVKIELEDLCLRYLHPEVYYKLREQVSKKKKEREQYIEDVTDLLTERLQEYEINAIVTGRAKHFYSIFKKMERRDVDFDHIHDLIAFRIIVDNITECYKALGVIHAIYKPVPGRFKDYVAMPKANSYQSLHTMVIGPGGERVEIQIRTQDMHTVAESGIAAHWKYKESGKSNLVPRESTDWVQRLLEWQKDLSDPAEFLETVKIDLFAEDVFVFTPKGEVKQLPFGATPLDFAYAIHTDVGHKCVSAKINGKMVPLRHKLKSGDTIEVITSPTQIPSKDWLKAVVTSSAKAKIRAYIKSQERDRAKKLGHDLLEKAFRKYDANLNRLDKAGQLAKAANEFGHRSSEDLFVAVGYGRIVPDEVVQKTLPKEELDKKRAELTPNAPEKESFLTKIFKSATKKSANRTAIRVAGLNDVLIRIARCCNPLPGDPIVGFITRGRGVTVHSANCSKALDTDPERKVDVAWNVKSGSTVNHAVKIRVIARDEPGLLGVMSQTITACNVNITSANVRVTKDRKAIAVFDIEVSDLSQLNKVTSALEGKKGVVSVERAKT